MVQEYEALKWTRIEALVVGAKEHLRVKAVPEGVLRGPLRPIRLVSFLNTIVQALVQVDAELPQFRYNL